MQLSCCCEWSEIFSCHSLAMSDLCALCHELFSRPKDKYLIQGRSKENLPFELESLPFTVDLTSSKHLCRRCVNVLKKRRNLIQQVCDIEKSLKTRHTGVSNTVDSNGHGNSSTNACERKRLNTETLPLSVSHSATAINNDLPSSAPVFSQSTPKKDPSQSSSQSIRTSVLSVPLSPILPSKKLENTEVYIAVKWPSKTAERKLPCDLESLGKMLLRGTYKQIAHAAWKNSSLKRELVLLFMKDIDKECSALCSKISPSCLRSPTKEKLLEFSIAKLCKELRDRAPLTFSMLLAASVNKRSKSRFRSVTPREDFWSPAVGMAAAVCLKNRSKFMNLLQLQISMFTYHSSWLVCIMFDVLHKFKRLYPCIPPTQGPCGDLINCLHNI